MDKWCGDMSDVKNGWDDNGYFNALSLKDKDYRQLNYVNGNWFGFVIREWSNGKLHYIGLFIDYKIFGWYEEYNQDGSIDTEWSGFYIRDVKI